MASDKRYSRKDSEKRGKKPLIIVVAFIVTALIMLFIFDKPISDYLGVQTVEEFFQEVEKDVLEEINKKDDNTSSSNTTQTNVDGTLEMYMIDVGQGDSFLFIQGENVLLYDAGTRGSGDDVVEFLKEKEIDKIDILIGSHTHDDHMGGITKVLNNFEVDNFYFPERTDVTTQWYLTLLDTVVQKEIKCCKANQGDIIQFGDASIQFITSTDPKEDKDINNSSIVIRITYDEIDFLLGGDIEFGVEKEILESGLEIQSEIFKASHHGSNTSNSSEFVQEVDPDSIYISCGEGNKYGHPCVETVELFKELNIPVYRTDEQGTVLVTTDGKEFTTDNEPASYSSGKEN